MFHNMYKNPNNEKSLELHYNGFRDGFILMNFKINVI